MTVGPIDALLLELVDRLGLQPGLDESAYGDVDDFPTTMTVLDVQPLSLMFAFWTGKPTEPDLRLPAKLQSFVDKESAKVSFEDGFAWLSLYDLSQESAESIEQLLRDFADALLSAGLPPPIGCVACGDEETAESIVLEGRLVRICPACAASLETERQRREEDLNRAAPWHGLALPMACTYVACGWMAFWLLIDLALEKWQPQVIWIDSFSILIAMGVLAAIGAVLGVPVGWVIRRSGLARLSPWAVSGVVVVSCGLLGEILYVAASIFRMAGVFNLRIAWQFLGPVMQTYPPDWIVAKLLTIAAITTGSAISASVRKSVTLAEVATSES